MPPSTARPTVTAAARLMPGSLAGHARMPAGEQPDAGAACESLSPASVHSLAAGRVGWRCRDGGTDDGGGAHSAGVAGAAQAEADGDGDGGGCCGPWHQVCATARNHWPECQTRGSPLIRRCMHARLGLMQTNHGPGYMVPGTLHWTRLGPAWARSGYTRLRRPRAFLARSQWHPKTVYHPSGARPSIHCRAGAARVPSSTI